MPEWGNSLSQMNSFGPKVLSTSLTSQNSHYLYNSIVTSSVVSGGLNFGYNACNNSQSPSSNLFKRELNSPVHKS